MLHLGSVTEILVQPPKPKLEIFTSNYVVAEDLCLSIAFLVSTMFMIVLPQSSKCFVFQISYGSFLGQTCVQPLFLPQKAQMLQRHHDFTHQANLIVKSICKHEGRLKSRGAYVCSWSQTILRFAILLVIILRYFVKILLLIWPSALSQRGAFTSSLIFFCVSPISWG